MISLDFKHQDIVIFLKVLVRKEISERLNPTDCAPAEAVCLHTWLKPSLPSLCLKTCGSIDSAVVRRAGETQGNAKAFHTCKCTRDRTRLGSLTKNAGNETDKKPGENEDYWSNDDKNSVPLPPPSLFQHLLSAAATTQTSLTDKMERPVWSLPYVCLSKIMS